MADFVIGAGGAGSPSTLTSPVTTDPLTFSGALTFSKNVVLTKGSNALRSLLIGSEAGTDRWLFGDKAGDGNAYNGIQGGFGLRTQLGAYYGIELVGNSGNSLQTPTTGSQPSDPGTTVRNVVAANKALVVKGAASQSVNLFEAQNSAGAISAAFDSAGLLQLGTNTGTYLYAIGGTGALATDTDFTIRSNTKKLFFGGGADVAISRVAAGVLGVAAAGGLTAPTMTGDALMLANVSVAPSTNPVGGGVIYCEAGALKYRGTGGTVTTLGAA